MWWGAFTLILAPLPGKEREKTRPTEMRRQASCKCATSERSGVHLLRLAVKDGIALSSALFGNAKTAQVKYLTATAGLGKRGMYEVCLVGYYYSQSQATSRETLQSCSEVDELSLETDDRRLTPSS